MRSKLKRAIMFIDTIPDSFSAPELDSWIQKAEHDGFEIVGRFIALTDSREDREDVAASVASYCDLKKIPHIVIPSWGYITEDALNVLGWHYEEEMIDNLPHFLFSSDDAASEQKALREGHHQTEIIRLADIPDPNHKHRHLKQKASDA